MTEPYRTPVFPHEELSRRIQQVWGKAWEVELYEPPMRLDEKVLRVVRRGGMREVPAREVRKTSGDTHMLMELIYREIESLRMEVDPNQASREKRLNEEVAQAREAQMKAEVELAGAKAIIADLFRQAREAKP